MWRTVGDGSVNMKSLPAIGLVGVAVIGEILILKMTSNGCNVTAYNRSQDKVDAFLAGRASGRNIRGVRKLAGDLLINI